MLVTVHEGRLLAFPEDGPGVFLMPKGEHTFTPVMTEEAGVAFEVGNGPATALTFEQPGKAMRYVRVG